MDLCLVHGIQLCYNKSEIRAAPRAICDTATFRTHCRSETEVNPIRAAKCCFEPRGTRLPDARISKPHPRKGTETHGKFLLILRPAHHFKTTSPQGDGNHSLKISYRFESSNFKITSPQGDGNLFAGACKPAIVSNFKTTSPQGDGNQIGTAQVGIAQIGFQNHIPARGRHTQGALAPFFSFLGSL